MQDDHKYDQADNQKDDRLDDPKIDQTNDHRVDQSEDHLVDQIKDHLVDQTRDRPDVHTNDSKVDTSNFSTSARPRTGEAIQKFCLLIVLLCTVAITSLNVLPDLLLHAPAQTWRVEKSDVIIVLGTPANKKGKAGPTLRERVLKGVELLKDGYAPYIMFTGAAAHNGFVEAEVMSDLAKTRGVDESQIVLEPEAKNTAQNAFDSVAIMRKRGWKSAIVVTSAAHIRRSNFIFSHYPIKYSVIGCEDPQEQSLYDRLVFDQREKFYLLNALITRQPSSWDLTESQAAELKKMEQSPEDK
ncbi:MAG: YdcF family protein [Candidatus Melainabacteria bacterium]|nr:YdcF family protein [Candidatus Melainabacteria bacterium]